MSHDNWHQIIAENPWDPSLRLRYAEWLSSKGDARGELLRIQEELRKIEVVNRADQEVRMQRLLNDGVKPITIVYSNSLGMEFVLIYPGEYRMGASSRTRDRWDWEMGRQQQVAQQVEKPFLLGKCVVTQADWLQCLETRPWGEDEEDQHARFPATHVNHDDATAFCQLLTEDLDCESQWANWTYTLPTEVQWEYACRAGTSTRYSFGDDASGLKEAAWYFDPHQGGWWDDPQDLIQVSQKNPNPWGLYDMHGNVWEWCMDRSEDDTFAILRGGASNNYAHFCRSNIRNAAWPGTRCDEYGFRIAMVPPS